MKYLILVVLLVVAATSTTADDKCVVGKPKPNYKVSRLSVQDVGVSCLNGQPPEVEKVGKLVVVSCDAE